MVLEGSKNIEKWASSCLSNWEYGQVEWRVKWDLIIMEPDQTRTFKNSINVMSHGWTIQLQSVTFLPLLISSVTSAHVSPVYISSY